MRLLLTGGAGFVGSHVVEGVIKNTDWDIVIIDKLNYAGNLNRLSDIKLFNGKYYEPLFESKEGKRIKFVWHDMSAPISDTIHSMIGEVDYCWHLAAESHVENSLSNPVAFAYNVVATTNLLHYLRNFQPNLKRYIGFNTDEVFGPAPEGVFFKETDKFYPSNPYSASKVGQWAMEYAFYKSYRMPIIITHSMNIFGERQDPEKFVPKVTRRVVKGEKIPIHGLAGNESSRCWVHAREVGGALLFLNEKGVNGEVYNIVGEERTVLNLANRISRIITGKVLEESDLERIDFHSTRPGHDLRYALDGSKLLGLGFEYKMSLEQSFDKMVRWMVEDENKHWLNL